MTPERGDPGASFSFSASGYEQGERVGYRLSRPAGAIERFDRARSVAST